jgi:hypothetical protein
MAEQMESHMYLTGFRGGTCPSCGFEGRLWENHVYIDEHTRVMVHGDTREDAVSCTMPLTGRLNTSPSGTWSYDPDWSWE